MILVADSGSTKTDWCKYENGFKSDYSTLGVNPMIHSVEYITEALLSSNIFYDIKNKVQNIYFYGAGCSADGRNNKVKSVLQPYFPNAKIDIEHDMLAAVIALHGDSDGIACIMGTGSNSVLQKDKQLIEKVPSLGYILGDEAGGVDLGKKFLIDFLYKKLPIEIYNYAKNELLLNKESILQNVYQNPAANKYMASFVPHITHFRGTEYIQQVLRDKFSLFFEYHILCYEDYEKFPIGCIGSIANIFSQELQAVAHSYHTSIDIFLQKPIESLTDYHIRNSNA